MTDAINARSRGPGEFDYTGKLVAAFMPFVGYGEGAPQDPEAPGQGPIIDDLVLSPGESITWVTEGLDPGVTERSRASWSTRGWFQICRLAVSSENPW